MMRIVLTTLLVASLWAGTTLAQPKVYITNGDSDDVSVISCPSGDVIDTIPVGATPFGSAMAPSGDLLYVGNIFDNNVSVIETATNTVVDTITVGAFPNAVAVTPDGNFLYVVNALDGTASVVDTTTNTVVDT
ncbi:MAG: YncE family protein, partial [Thermodesulfobacteriota bacterium]